MGKGNMILSIIFFILVTFLITYLIGIKTGKYDLTEIFPNFLKEKLSKSSISIGQVNQTGTVLNNVNCEAYPYCHNTLNDSSLVVYLPFDTTSKANRITYDYSINNNDGTETGNTYIDNVNCLYGSCAKFDGSTDYINILDANSLDFNTTTISFWLKYPKEIGSVNDSEVIRKWEGTGNQRSWGIYTNKSGNLKWQVSWNGTTSDGLTLDKVYNDSLWHNYIFIYNSTTLVAYVDGALNKTRTSAGLSGGIYQSTAQVKIGDSFIASRDFNGTIDEVMIFNRSLSATEISAIYNNQSYRFKTPASQLFNLNFTAGDNRINVTYNTTLLQGTAMQLRIREITNGLNTTWQTLTTGDNQLNIFNISASTNNITLEFNFSTDAYNFYSPILSDNIQIDTWLDSSSDTSYPIFSNYGDNNGTLTGNGIASFISSVSNTNGTVLLQVNNTNFTATHNSWLQFDGRNVSQQGIIHIADQPYYSPNKSNNAFTVSFWINVPTFNFVGGSDTSAYNAVHFLGKYNFDGAGVREWYFRLYNNSAVDGYNRGRTLSFYVFNLTGSIGEGSDIRDNATTAITFVENTWYHIVGVINVSSTLIYKDGVLRDTDPLSDYGIHTGDGTANLTIGKFYSTGPAREFSSLNGSLDDIRIYNRTLTSAEIATLNNSGRTSNKSLLTDGLVGYWNLDESNGNLIYDSSSYGNNGTLTSGVTLNNSDYSALVNLSTGVYPYQWISWGNGTFNLFNISATRYYTVNGGANPPADSCTYSSGNWNVACSDNCSITSNVAISSGGNISLTGSGSFYLLANLTGWTQIYKDNACMLYKANGAVISK